MSKAFGLFVDQGRACLALVSGGRRGYRILSFHEETIGTGDEAAGNLRKLFEKAGASGRTVYSAVDGRVALVRLLSLPLTNPRQIQRTIPFQAESLAGSTPLERLAVDHHVVARRSDGSDVLLFAVERDLVDRTVGLITAAGGRPGGVTLDSAALFNLASAGGGTAGRRCAVVARDGDSATIVLADGRGMTMSRTMKTGNGGLSAARISEEIKRSLVLSGSSDGLETAFVAGSDTGTLYTGLAEALSVPVQVLDPLSSLETYRNAPPPAQGVFAVGAALSGIGAAPLAVDFLRGMGGEAGMWASLRPKLLYAAAAACLIFLFLCAGAWEEAAEEQGKLDEIVSKERGLWDQASAGLGLRGEFKPQHWDKTMESAIKKAGRSTEPKSAQYVSFLSKWQMMARALDGAQATVANIAFDQDKTVITGQVGDIDKFEKLVTSFRAVFGNGISEKFEKKAKGQQKSAFTIEIGNR